MAELLDLISRDQEEINSIYKIARRASQMKASPELYQASREFFGMVKPNGKPAFKVIKVNHRWTPLISFLEDPVVRRFLDHVILDRYFMMVPREHALSLLRDLDPRYRSELAPALEHLPAKGVLKLILDTLDAKIAKANQIEAANM